MVFPEPDAAPGVRLQTDLPEFLLSRDVVLPGVPQQVSPLIPLVVELQFWGLQGEVSLVLALQSLHPWKLVLAQQV